MNCEEYVDTLGDYLDGTLAADARQRLERHLAGCERCRGTADDLARIRATARALPDRTPPDRVWARIEGDLAREAQAPARPRRGWPLRASRPGWFSRPFVPASLAAAAVLLLAVGIGYFTLDRGGQAPGRAPAAGVSTVATGRETPAPATNDELVRSVQEELTLAESHYDKAIAGLEQITKAGQGSLDPQVLATLQKNMALIDQAITDSRQALRSQPTSQLAQESLFEAFRRKVALLQDTVALINEMRKGNEAGAAKIIGNLNKS